MEGDNEGDGEFAVGEGEFAGGEFPEDGEGEGFDDGEGEGFDDDDDFPEGEGQADAEGEFEPDVDHVNVTTNISKDRGAMDAMLAKEDLGIVHSRIQENVRILSSFKELRDPNKKRTEYMTDLMNDVVTAYDYNLEMVDIFFSLFNPAEAIRCIEANEEARPVTIRTNTIKTKRRDLAKILIHRGVNCEPIGEWSKVGLKIYDSQVPIGATPEYLAGHYILQSPSSFLPVMALCPQPGERVLDMAASPGGKTTYIAQLMKNSGVLFANDLKKERLKSLTANIQRLGIKNCIVTNYDGRYYDKTMKGFDRVLLDSPCSGLGVISRDPSIKAQKTYNEIMKLSHLQKQLILAAIDCCDFKSKTGGYIVYSTCSITVEENEAVIDYALKHRYVKLVDTGLEVGNEGLYKYKERRYHPSLKLTKRIYPHTHNMDGFFVAKLKKYAHGVKSDDKEKDTLSIKREEAIKRIKEKKRDRKNRHKKHEEGKEGSQDKKKFNKKHSGRKDKFGKHKKQFKPKEQKDVNQTEGKEQKELNQTTEKSEKKHKKEHKQENANAPQKVQKKENNALPQNDAKGKEHKKHGKGNKEHKEKKFEGKREKQELKQEKLVEKKEKHEPKQEKSAEKKKEKHEQKQKQKQKQEKSVEKKKEKHDNNQEKYIEKKKEKKEMKVDKSKQPAEAKQDNKKFKSKETTQTAVVNKAESKNKEFKKDHKKKDKEGKSKKRQKVTE